MAAGLALSFSRAGVTLGALALALTLALATMTARRTRFRRPRAVWGMAAALVLLALVPLSVRGPGRLATMAEDLPQELSATAGRPVVWAGALNIGMDHPLLGAGLGTFGGTFPRYRPLAVQSTYTHAHQDYLQWFAETGFLGVICALLFAGGLIVVATRSLRPRAYGHGRYMACGLIAGLGGLALHGLVDFNGHIPANTLMAAVMAGMLVVLARPLPGESAA
jgi:O-antigen ligase